MPINEKKIDNGIKKLRQYKYLPDEQDCFMIKYLLDRITSRE